MGYYFNVKLEFDQNKVDSIIESTILKDGKGFVCSVERNSMTKAINDPDYRKNINQAIVNICDGSFVAKTVSWAYKKNCQPYIGADLFMKYIKKQKYKQYFLGNTPEVLNGLRKELSKIDPAIANMPFVTLPFNNVMDFDYPEIGKKIDSYSPDIIWVSLGAPKQEAFMYYLEPYISKGVMFGFGAIFNFYSGLPGQRRAPQIFLKFRLEWLFRLLQEPSKNFVRNWDYLKLAPKLIFDERRKPRN